MKAKWRIGSHYGDSIKDPIFIRGKEYEVKKVTGGNVKALSENGKWETVNAKAFWLDKPKKGKTS